MTRLRCSPIARLALVLASAALLGSPGVRGADRSANITPDDPASVQRGIEAAYRSGARSVVVPPGVYRLPLSSPQKGQPENFHLLFSDLKDFTINATGVTFVLTEPGKRAFLLRNSENVTLQGVTFLRETPPFSQGKVEAIAPDRASVDIRIDKGYPTDLDNTDNFPRISVINLYRAGTRELKPLVPDLYVTKVDRLGPDLFRFHFRVPMHAVIPAEVGDRAAWRGPGNPDICVWESAGVRLKDVTIKNSLGIAFFETAGEGGNHYEHCVVTYAPPPPGAVEPPLLASAADGLHSASARHGPTLDDCHFEGMDDDAVNIHGTYAMLMEAKGKTLVIDWRAPHTGARVPLLVGRPGDPLRIYDRSAALRAEANIVAVRPMEHYQPGDLGKVESRVFSQRDKAVYYEVEVDRRVEGEPGGFVANPAQGGRGFVIRNCSFRNNRGHGLFIRADGGLIERCTVEGTAMAGIVVGPEMNSWNEADYSRGTTIQDNVIRNVGVATQPWNSGVTVAGFEFGRYAALPGGHRDIVVRRNTFEDNRGPNLIVSSTVGVRVEDNRFLRPMGQPAYHVENRGWDNPGALIWMRQASRIVLKGNTVSAPGTFYKIPLDVDPSVSGDNLSAGVGLEAP